MDHDRTSGEVDENILYIVYSDSTQVVFNMDCFRKGILFEFIKILNRSSIFVILVWGSEKKNIKLKGWEKSLTEKNELKLWCTIFLFKTSQRSHQTKRKLNFKTCRHWKREISEKRVTTMAKHLRLLDFLIRRIFIVMTQLPKKK